MYFMYLALKVSGCAWGNGGGSATGVHIDLEDLERLSALQHQLSLQ